MVVYKAGDSPLGTAGGDEWLGTIDITEEVRRVMVRNPMLNSFRVSFGLS